MFDNFVLAIAYSKAVEASVLGCGKVEWSDQRNSHFSLVY